LNSRAYVSNKTIATVIKETNNVEEAFRKAVSSPEQKLQPCTIEEFQLLMTDIVHFYKLLNIDAQTVEHNEPISASVSLPM
jgi:hypothetical protein